MPLAWALRTTFVRFRTNVVRYSFGLGSPYHIRSFSNECGTKWLWLGLSVPHSLVFERMWYDMALAWGLRTTFGCFRANVVRKSFGLGSPYHTRPFSNECDTNWLWHGHPRPRMQSLHPGSWAFERKGHPRHKTLQALIQMLSSTWQKSAQKRITVITASCVK